VSEYIATRTFRNVRELTETLVLTGSEDKTARLWDISTIPRGNIFDIACAWLPDHVLKGLGKDYELDLSSEPPICQKDASGKFTTPLPDPPMAK
jgi:WD40 repeat protein